MDPATGGPCQGIRNSIPELKKRGINNEVVCLDDPALSFLKEDSFQIHALGAGKGPWCYSPKLIPWLLENLRRFDAVIIHGLWLYPSHAATKAIKLLKNNKSKKEKKRLHIPQVFVMPHGMLDPYFQTDLSRKMKALRNWFYWKLIESEVVNKADGLLFTCKEELVLAREPFRPYHPKKEINVGYGIKEPPLFALKMKQEFLKLCPQLRFDSYFLFLSRIHQKKGIENLIRAYEKVANKMQGEHNKSAVLQLSFPKLVIAGPGLETRYGKKMQSLVQESKTLQHSVFFPGMLTGNAKWGAFYGSEAFILPSHQENFGIAVVEALACGKPVLISNKVNIWKEISTSNAGIVHDDTLDGTINLLNDFKLLTVSEKNKMAAEARITYEKYFNVAVVSQQLIDAIGTKENFLEMV